MENWYDQEEDILNIQLKDNKYLKSVELPNGIVFDIAQDGSIISIEVMNASKIFRGDIKKVIDAASACSKN